MKLYYTQYASMSTTYFLGVAFCWIRCILAYNRRKQMGRMLTKAVRASRLQLSVTEDDKARFEEARLKYRPRMQFQDFLLELMDLGLEMEEREAQMLKDYMDGRTEKAHEGKAVSA
jgi:hypothetical protein